VKKKKFQISLASYVAVASAILTAVAMGIYAMFQFNAHPGHTIRGLIIEHSWHVIVLGFLTYVVLYLVFLYHIQRPIMKLWVKAYAISKGYDDYAEVNSAIKEIQEISDAISMIKAQLKRNEQTSSKENVELDVKAFSSSASNNDTRSI